jgi:hypothetical protein
MLLQYFRDDDLVFKCQEQYSFNCLFLKWSTTGFDNLLYVLVTFLIFGNELWRHRKQLIVHVLLCGANVVAKLDAMVLMFSFWRRLDSVYAYTFLGVSVLSGSQSSLKFDNIVIALYMHNFWAVLFE